MMMMGDAKLPLLCDCQRLESCVEHQSMDSSYVLRVMHADAAHAVFLDRKWLDRMVYIDGQRTFLDLMREKGPDESCHMISRLLLGALRYKPDYLVIVSEDGTGAPLTSGCTMDFATRCADDMASVRRAAEGPCGVANYLGRKLTVLCGVLSDRGFFNDPKNRKYISKG